MPGRGITANPALGEACDLLVAQGGTGVLAETPEIYGAEHLLTERAIDRATGDRLIGLINWWEDYTARNRGSMDNNPSPGNKKGGLTTILEKSLGAAAKGGTTPLTGVYKYAEPVRAQGFTFMDSPGYDPASVTGQIAGAVTLCASPRVADPPLDQSPHQPSNCLPTRRCMNAWWMTWISIVGTSSQAARQSNQRDVRFMNCSCASPRAKHQDPRRRVWVIMNSCHGKLGR